MQPPAPTTLITPSTSLTPITPLITPSPLICHDTDFNVVCRIVDVLLEHAVYIYKGLPAQSRAAYKNQKDLLEKLPVRFTTAEALEIAKKENISERSAHREIKKFVTNGLLTKAAHGIYEKPK